MYFSLNGSFNIAILRTFKVIVYIGNTGDVKNISFTGFFTKNYNGFRII